MPLAATSRDLAIWGKYAVDDSVYMLGVLPPIPFAGLLAFIKC